MSMSGFLPILSDIAPAKKTKTSAGAVSSQPWMSWTWFTSRWTEIIVFKNIGQKYLKDFVFKV